MIYYYEVILFSSLIVKNFISDRIMESFFYFYISLENFLYSFFNNLEFSITSNRILLIHIFNYVSKWNPSL